MVERTRDIDLPPPGYGPSLTGSSQGLQRLGDYDDNTTLGGDLRIRHRRLRAMRLQNPTLGGQTALYAAQLSAPTAHIEREEHQSEEVADALERLFGLGTDADESPPIGYTWPALINELTPALWHGHLAAGIGWYTADGIHWPYIEVRQPTQYYRYHVAADGKSLGALELRSDSLSYGGTRMMPLYDANGLRRTMYLAFRGGERLGAGDGGFDGVSLLRHAFGDHEDAIEARMLRRAAMQRHALGFPVAVIDEERYFATRFSADELATLPPQDKINALQTEMDRISTQLMSLNNTTGMHVVYPSWITNFQLLNTGNTFDPEPLTGVVNSADRSCAEAIHAAFLTQGRQGDGGSRAMVETQSEAMPRAIEAYLRWFVSEIRRQIIAPFLALNFPSVKPRETPTLRTSEVVAPPWMSNFGSFIESAVEIGLLRLTDADLRYYRETIGFRPGASEEEATGDVMPTVAATPSSQMPSDAPEGEPADDATMAADESPPASPPTPARPSRLIPAGGLREP